MILLYPTKHYTEIERGYVMAGMIHLYIGDGKGKTTAAVGLAMRVAGSDRKVVFAQFLKSRSTGEIVSLKKLGIEVIRSDIEFGFTWTMNEKQKEECKNEQQRIFDSACKEVQDCLNVKNESEIIAVLFLDEIVDAVGKDMINQDMLRDFLTSKPEGLEIVMTGHEAVDWLIEMSDYVTVMKKIKHPFDEGVAARDTIEY